MPVTIVTPYCDNCTCESCLRLRNPETPEQAGWRLANEFWQACVKPGVE